MLPDRLRRAAAAAAGALAVTAAVGVVPGAAQATTASVPPGASATTVPVPPAPAYDLATPVRPATSAGCAAGCVDVRRDSVTTLKGTFRAVGDGVADDTAALRAFLDTAASTGKTRVFLPSGVYRVTGQLLVPAGVRTIEGEGMGGQADKATVLRLDWASIDGFGHQFVLRASAGSTGVTVRNLVVDGGRRAELGPDCGPGRYGEACPQNHGGGINPGSGWTIQQVRFVGLNYFKTWVCRVHGVRITGARYDNTPVPAWAFPTDPAQPGGGTPLSGAEDNIGGGCGASNVTIEKTMWDRSILGNAIDLTRASGVRFRDNVVLGHVPDGDAAKARGSVIFEAVVSAPGAPTDISGNRLDRAGMSIISNGDYCTAPAASARANGTINPRGLVVRRNTIVGAPWGGIVLRYDGSDIIPIAAPSQIVNGTAAHGTCVPKDTEASRTVAPGGGNTIADNVVVDPAQVGILVWGTDEKWKTTPDRITGNTVVNPGAGNDGAPQEAWRQDVNTGSAKFPLAGIVLGIGTGDAITRNTVTDPSPSIPLDATGKPRRPYEHGVAVGANPVGKDGVAVVLAQPQRTAVTANTTSIGGVPSGTHHPLPVVTAVRVKGSRTPVEALSTAGATTLVLDGQGFGHGLDGVGFPATSRIRFGGPEGVKATGVTVVSDTQLEVTTPAVTVPGDLELFVSNDVASLRAVVRGRSGTERAVSPRWTAPFRAPDRTTLPQGDLLPATGGIVHVSSDQPFGASATELAAARVTVTVGSRPARAVWVDGHTLAVRVPPGSPGAPAPVVVTRAGLTGVPASARYAAVVTAVGPAAGGVAGGTTVRVTGRGLSGGSDWRFGSLAAACRVTSDSAATCTAPDATAVGAGVLPVSFTPAGGTPYLATTRAAYTYR